MEAIRSRQAVVCSRTAASMPLRARSTGRSVVNTGVPGSCRHDCASSPASKPSKPSSSSTSMTVCFAARSSPATGAAIRPGSRGGRARSLQRSPRLEPRSPRRIDHPSCQSRAGWNPTSSLTRCSKPVWNPFRKSEDPAECRDFPYDRGRTANPLPRNGPSFPRSTLSGPCVSSFMCHEVNASHPQSLSITEGT